ncbi:chorismate synthase, partial [Staphylococcus aureus]|uniref:chorismate synthase n=1 Tax=Staphylococcus aureus TaxID=1280 RepID=UPI00210B1A79
EDKNKPGFVPEHNMFRDDVICRRCFRLKNYNEVQDVGLESEEERENMKRTITKPRPGQADLVGGMKYNHRDLRNVLERSSARETAARVAVGALCKVLLLICGCIPKLGALANIIPLPVLGGAMIAMFGMVMAYGVS